MKIKKTFCVIGIIGGVIAIIMGIVLNSNDVWNSRLERAIFGADFYTEVYDGVNEAADNTETIAIGIKYLLVTIGLFQICFFGVKLGSVQAAEETTAAFMNKATQIIDKLDAIQSFNLTDSKIDSNHHNYNDDLPSL